MITWVQYAFFYAAINYKISCLVAWDSVLFHFQSALIKLWSLSITIELVICKWVYILIL